MAEKLNHKRIVERAKRKSYLSGHAKIDAMTFHEAWGYIATYDPGLPKEPPEDTTEDSKRAILGLAIMVADLRFHWS